MQFSRTTLAACDSIRGAAVVIDVLRAFTTAAYALAGGARRILLTRTVEDAFALRERFSDAWIMGEVDGLKVTGFDFGNSPAELDSADLHGRTLIQRTGHGTQGAALAAHARPLLACSFANAAATAAHLYGLKVERVAFVVTGALDGEGFLRTPIGQGDEDAACADYLEALLRGEQPDPEPYLERVRRAPAANKFLDPEQSDFSAVDLDYCTRLDVFDFAMPITRERGMLVLKRASPSPASQPSSG
jgi:2-phosphosulfolactate phosphatase